MQCSEVHFASFLSGGFITAIVVYPPERKLAKRTSVQFIKLYNSAPGKGTFLSESTDVFVITSNRRTFGYFF
jgi:hypothetical protein